MGDFQNLETNRIHDKMLPVARRIYAELFPACKLVPPDRVFDQRYGIDLEIRGPDGHVLFTLQQKFRDHAAWKNPKFRDFTQEVENAVGTPSQAPGEWFHLYAHLYFYGWANADETDFIEWLILDITRYKLLALNVGGIANLRGAELMGNDRHGKAAFYGIPTSTLYSVILFSNLLADTEERILQSLQHLVVREQVKRDTPCPVCGDKSVVEVGRLFVHTWCLHPTHWDKWEPINNLKFKETGVPVLGHVNHDDINW